MKSLPRIGSFFHAPIFSPRGFLFRAGLILMLFVAMHWAGLRQDTSILSGTSPSSGSWDRWSAGLGVVYALSYFSATLIAPILIIAAFIFHRIDRKLPSKAAIKIPTPFL